MPARAIVDGPTRPLSELVPKISVELQARILDLSARLSDLDHFQVLGVELTAERVQIKRAYFSMIGAYARRNGT